MKNCMRLPPSITATYLPNEPTMTPASTCADSCAANATIPSGNAQIRALISVNNTSCKPKITLVSACMFSLLGMNANVNPMAAATRRMLSTLPLANGSMTLLGITPSIWS